MRYRRKPLGDYGALEGNEVFAAARKDAEAWAEKVEAGGVRVEKLMTVADACRSYLHLKPSSITEGVFRRHVFDDPLARVRLDRIRRHHLAAWRKRLEAAPALVSRSKEGTPITRPRSPSTINRDMVPLRAALHRVLSPGAPNSDAAWQEALKPIKGADRRRELYLDQSERRLLLDAATSELAPFLKALCQLPLRPGALANLEVSSFEARTRSLTIGEDKNGLPRQIAVPRSVADFLAEQQVGKKREDPLFARANGRPWNKDSWKKPIKAAAKDAELTCEVTAYALRHSVLTDLIRQGLPALTVAQLSGTSIAMIERHYGHLVRDDAEKALDALSL